MPSASSSTISPHRTSPAYRPSAVHANSQNPPPPAAHSDPDTPPSPHSRHPTAPESHLCKAPSSEIPQPVAPLRAQSAQIPPSRASSPQHPRLPIDPDPIPSTCPTAPAPRPPQFAAPPPSSASTQNPPSSRPALPAYLSPPHFASSTPANRYCRIPPPHSPQSAVSAPRATTHHSRAQSANTPIHPYPSRAAAILPSKSVPPASNTPLRSSRSKSAAPPEITAWSQTPALSAFQITPWTNTFALR